jgi:hypothetical protein
LEYAFAKKHETLEQIKADCKKSKTPKDEEKKLVSKATKKLDSKRKEGMAELTKKMNHILLDDSQIASEKITRLNDKE